MHVSLGLTLSQQVNTLLVSTSALFIQRSRSRCQQKYAEHVFSSFLTEDILFQA
jgi:hypothetical protein